jgi:hypothetical protein
MNSETIDTTNKMLKRKVATGNENVQNAATPEKRRNTRKPAAQGTREGVKRTTRVPLSSLDSKSSPMKSNPTIASNPAIESIAAIASIALNPVVPVVPVPTAPIAIDPASLRQPQNEVACEVLSGSRFDPYTESITPASFSVPASPALRIASSAIKPSPVPSNELPAANAARLSPHNVELQCDSLPEAAPNPRTRAKDSSKPTRTRGTNRKDKSLAKICERFLEMCYGFEEGQTISLDVAATQLAVGRRRMYDIVHVLQSIGVLCKCVGLFPARFFLHSLIV